jgi:AraC-like DNA-binding protein
MSNSGSRPPPGRSRRKGPVVLGWILPHLIALVASKGDDAGRIRELPGIRGCDFDDPDLHVPEAVVQQVWELAEVTTGDDALGIHLAEALPRGALDLVEYAFRSSASLGDGLERLARYGRVMSDRFAAAVDQRGPDLVIVLGDTGPYPLHHARVEFSLAIVLRLARDGTGRDLVPRAVTFTHPAPPDSSEHLRFFGPGVRFSDRVTAAVLSASDGRLPFVGADPALSAIVRRRLDKVLAARNRPSEESTASHVRRTLFEGLGQALPSPSTIARELGVSLRTLARRLAREQTSFRRLLDEVRCTSALTLLQDPTLSVSDVAFFLHYSEPAAFHRSFRRWTGQSPRRYRHRGRDE